VVSGSSGLRNHSHFRFVNAFDASSSPKPFTNGYFCIFLLNPWLFFPFYGACEWFRDPRHRETIRISNLRMLLAPFLLRNHSQMDIYVFFIESGAVFPNLWSVRMISSSLPLGNHSHFRFANGFGTLSPAKPFKKNKETPY
jgi:hypothetical protein